jgi:GDPmannose 4,6-dehydratase
MDMMTSNLQETMVNKKIEFANILNIHDAKKVRDWTTKAVIITGVTGQDGSLMVDYLLRNTSYQIFGGVRRLSVQNHDNIHHVNNPRFHLINFDLTDSHSISRIIENLKPDYFLNFAAQSFVAASWDFARQTWETNTTAVLDILEAVRLYAPQCRVYNCGSSEEMGNVVYSPQDELHPLRPRSPYAASKASARQLIKVYRESYNLYAVQGWLFNHEGVRRGKEFVTRKITRGVARIYDELMTEVPIIVKPIELGNLDSCRDWSDAEDCVDAIWRMVNQDIYNPNLSDLDQSELIGKLSEYVVSSGKTHSIRQFVEKAFDVVDIKGDWVGDGVDEYFRLVADYVPEPEIKLVVVNPVHYRPAEVDVLIGDSSRIRNELGWVPKTSFDQLVEKMVRNDLAK